MMRRLTIEGLDVEIGGLPGHHQWIIYNDFGWLAFRSDHPFETEDDAIADLRNELNRARERRALQQLLGL